MLKGRECKNAVLNIFLNLIPFFFLFNESINGIIKFFLQKYNLWAKSSKPSSSRILSGTTAVTGVTQAELIALQEPGRVQQFFEE